MGVCGCVIPNPNCHCHFTPVSDWQYNNSTNHFITMPKSVLDQIGKEHTEEIERLRQLNAELVEALQTISKWQPTSATQPRQKIIDNMQLYARLSITKATGGE